ncbi:nucleoside deaminase [Myroides sp. N17-2]|uniref:nucleoside deaminase n=1 Tax=Myroides sp. N17-2 TaxID=2030799 RepID=UPI000EFC192C|nr:nucleoside deaminase [Myroides sp. N17-2]
MNTHEFYIRKCIELGMLAKRFGDSPVGAILVKEGQIVAEAIEAGKSKKDITCHAEIEVIRRFREENELIDLTGYTMYTTHEPCIMCAYVIRQHKISTVVWSISTGNIGGYSSAYPILKDNTIAKWGGEPVIVKGVLEEECVQAFL